MRRATVVVLALLAAAVLAILGGSAAAVDGAQTAAVHDVETTASGDLAGTTAGSDLAGATAGGDLADATAGPDALQDDTMQADALQDNATQTDATQDNATRNGGASGRDSEAVNRSEQRAAVASGERLVEACATPSPADHDPPAGDAVGWEDGYWYDEPVAVEDPESLTEPELEAVVARTAARVEALRCLEFASVPPVELVNRSEMADRQTRAVSNRSQAAEQFDDARLEAALLVGTDVDPAEARISTRTAAVQASYDPATGRVALLAPDGNATATGGTADDGSTGDDGGTPDANGTADGDDGGTPDANGTADGDDGGTADDGSTGDDGSTADGTGTTGETGPSDAEQTQSGGVRLDEATLAHELTHALQDQAFDLSRLDAWRTDAALAESGLVEGDAVLVERRYEQRCGSGGWNQSCLTATPSDGDGDPNVPLNLLLYQPYNDGPGFVAQLYDDGGWAVVDERYERPPTTTREVIYPNTDDGADQNLTLAATSTRQWRRIRPPNGPNDDVVGAGAIAATLLAPTFEGVHDPIYDPEAIQRNSRQSTGQSDRRFDYRLDAVEGWQADRLVAYENDGGQVASVWRSRWATADDAETFRSQYTDLLEIRGASPAVGYQGTYRFSDGSDYDGVVYVRRQGSEVVVVHGPDVSALRSLYDDAAPRFEGGFFGDVLPGAGDVALDELSVSTALTALVAVLLAAVAVRRWERRQQ